MDYRTALKQLIMEYRDGIMEIYQVTTTAAMKDAKKLGMFKKRSFGGHIDSFRSHMEDAKALDVDAIDIPEGDEESRNLADLMKKSIQSFCLLCDLSIEFYQMAERKQYKDSGVSVEQYTKALSQMQRVLMRSLEDLNNLGQAYGEYHTDDLAD